MLTNANGLKGLGVKCIQAYKQQLTNIIAYVTDRMGGETFCRPDKFCRTICAYIANHSVVIQYVITIHLNDVSSVWFSVL